MVLIVLCPKSEERCNPSRGTGSWQDSLHVFPQHLCPLVPKVTSAWFLCDNVKQSNSQAPTSGTNGLSHLSPVIAVYTGLEWVYHAAQLTVHTYYVAM